mmetsp:Transcript_30206/g.97177  ORF Transcript_30206/g.97177 Transcript_30206/m.97177 type:complete len:222 (-) Transcript_30206:73-738(-)
MTGKIVKSKKTREKPPPLELKAIEGKATATLFPVPQRAKSVTVHAAKKKVPGQVSSPIAWSSASSDSLSHRDRIDDAFSSPAPTTAEGSFRLRVLTTFDSPSIKPTDRDGKDAIWVSRRSDNHSQSHRSTNFSRAQQYHPACSKRSLNLIPKSIRAFEILDKIEVGELMLRSSTAEGAVEESEVFKLQSMARHMPREFLNPDRDKRNRTSTRYLNLHGNQK